MSDLIGNPEDQFSHNEAHMYSVNKGADRQCCHRTADLHLCFRTHLKQVFSWCDSFSTIPTLLSPIILSVKDVVVFSFGYLLAHLSRRLIGELIVYPWSGVRRRPSSSSVVHNAQTSSSQKPLGRSKPNFMWSLLG